MERTMQTMKKAFVILLALSLVLAALPALAESTPTGAGYSGTVDYRSTQTVRAPFGGTLADYTLRVGDEVRTGDAMFSLSTVKVYAPFDGTVRGLRAQAGDEAAGVNTRYGALLYLEPAGKYTLSATTNNAYDSDSTHNRNRYINEGDTVYLQSSDDHDRTGVGVITTVDGRNFTVEVLQSNLDMEDTVSIYRDDAFSTAQRIGSRARVKQADATAIAPEGSVLRCAVSEGQSVKRGDILFEMVTGTLDGLATADATVSAPADGVLLSLPVAAGSTIAKDDVLATYYTENDLWVKFDLDESDLDTVTVGSRVRVTLDALTGRDALEGTVASVATVPDATEDGVTYTAYAVLNQAENLRVGMSVSVYLQ